MTAFVPSPAPPLRTAGLRARWLRPAAIGLALAGHAAVALWALVPSPAPAPAIETIEVTLTADSAVPEPAAEAAAAMPVAAAPLAPPETMATTEPPPEPPPAEPPAPEAAPMPPQPQSAVGETASPQPEPSYPEPSRPGPSVMTEHPMPEPPAPPPDPEPPTPVIVAPAMPAPGAFVAPPDPPRRRAKPPEKPRRVIPETRPSAAAPVLTAQPRAEAAAAARASYASLLAAEIARHTFFPAEARARNADGSVGVSFTVGPSGTVVERSVIRSSGDPSLDAAALTILARVRTPPPPGGRFSTSTNIRFHLR